jgi:hypothetical protein
LPPKGILRTVLTGEPTTQASQTDNRRVRVIFPLNANKLGRTSLTTRNLRTTKVSSSVFLPWQAKKKTQKKPVFYPNLAEAHFADEE